MTVKDLARGSRRGSLAKSFTVMIKFVHTNQKDSQFSDVRFSDLKLHH